MSERQEGRFFESSNVTHSDSTMRMMLDSNDLLREIEVFLKGYYRQPVYDDEKQTMVYELIEVGEPKANDKGVQFIMSWLRTKINPLVSLGNISKEQYGDFLERARLNLGRNLMVQRINYGMSLASYTETMDICMECFETFFTSPIMAGHRGAFTQNNKRETKEIIQEDRKKLFGVI